MRLVCGTCQCRTQGPLLLPTPAPTSAPTPAPAVHKLPFCTGLLSDALPKQGSLIWLYSKNKQGKAALIPIDLRDFTGTSEDLTQFLFSYTFLLYTNSLKIPTQINM